MDELTHTIAGLVGHTHIAHLPQAAAAAESFRAPGMPSARFDSAASCYSKLAGFVTYSGWLLSKSPCS
jgi:hypothetical protein